MAPASYGFEATARASLSAGRAPAVIAVADPVTAGRAVPSPVAAARGLLDGREIPGRVSEPGRPALHVSLSLPRRPSNHESRIAASMIAVLRIAVILPAAPRRDGGPTNGVDGQLSIPGGEATRRHSNSDFPPGPNVQKGGKVLAAPPYLTTSKWQIRARSASVSDEVKRLHCVRANASSLPLRRRAMSRFLRL